MNAKIPHSVIVGGIEFQILRQPIPGTQMAEVNFKDGIITVSPSSSEENEWVSLIHEMLHIVIWQNGLQQRIHEDKTVSVEEITSSLDTGIYTMLRDNFYRSTIIKIEDKSL